MRHLLLIVLCSCGRFGFDGSRDAATLDSFDASFGGDVRDGDVLDGDALGCMTLNPSDDFTLAGLACGSWGSPSMKGTVTARNSGVLEVTLQGATTGDDFGGCTIANYDLTQGGVFLAVLSSFTGTNGYTNMMVYSPTGFGIQIDGANNNIKALGGGMVQGVQQWDPIAMKYWQITATGSIVHMSVSPDAVQWTELGTLDRGTDDLTKVNVTFGAGRPGGVASGITTFDNFNVCP